MCNCGIVDQLMDVFIFSSVKIISTLCLLLTCFYNLSICVFMIWLASQTSWLELFNEPSRAIVLTSRAITSRAVTSRAGLLSSPSRRYLHGQGRIRARDSRARGSRGRARAAGSGQNLPAAWLPAGHRSPLEM